MLHGKNKLPRHYVILLQRLDSLFRAQVRRKERLPQQCESEGEVALRPGGLGGRRAARERRRPAGVHSEEPAGEVAESGRRPSAAASYKRAYWPNADPGGTGTGPEWTGMRREGSVKAP